MIVITIKDFGSTRIEIARKGKSLRGFSKEIGISQSYLSQVLNGKRNPSASVAYKIAKGLMLEVEDIFFVNNVANDNPHETNV
ncbi:helix-turn-helix domain-containing protein [Domibacillus mangrovi]|uniref:HTH cro/C1-type domain-containing protein n=1 Tax=Domibacillus mangrovi TaxID=1714354 RepID=A0A1Q5P621_9BACI|nr:helix-turn-helix transcriptional regulator [Domibacillus mangrovi]OKL37601.1 hypothetical protein BLL40_04665 [Domibacillus mangrovi]